MAHGQWSITRRLVSYYGLYGHHRIPVKFPFGRGPDRACENVTVVLNNACGRGIAPLPRHHLNTRTE
jgi:hypothetical protein